MCIGDICEKEAELLAIQKTAFEFEGDGTLGMGIGGTQISGVHALAKEMDYTQVRIGFGRDNSQFEFNKEFGDDVYWFDDKDDTT